jgi:hypothetical protein
MDTIGPDSISDQLSMQEESIHEEPGEQSESDAVTGSEDQIVNHDQMSAHDLVDEEMQYTNAESQVVPNSEVLSNLHSQSAESTFSISEMRTGDVSFVIPGMNAVCATQGLCFICGSRNGRNRVQLEARVGAWVKRRIFIPSGNRCCKEHLVDGLLKEEALSQIKPGRSSALMTGKAVASWIFILTDVFCKPRCILDFEGTSPLTNDDYEMLLGVSRENFDRIMEQCQMPMRRSRNRYDEPEKNIDSL